MKLSNSLIKNVNGLQLTVDGSLERLFLQLETDNRQLSTD